MDLLEYFTTQQYPLEDDKKHMRKSESFRRIVWFSKYVCKPEFETTRFSHIFVF